MSTFYFKRDVKDSLALRFFKTAAVRHDSAAGWCKASAFGLNTLRVAEEDFSVPVLQKVLRLLKEKLFSRAFANLKTCASSEEALFQRLCSHFFFCHAF